MEYIQSLTRNFSKERLLSTSSSQKGDPQQIQRVKHELMNKFDTIYLEVTNKQLKKLRMQIVIQKNLLIGREKPKNSAENSQQSQK